MWQRFCWKEHDLIVEIREGKLASPIYTSTGGIAELGEAAPALGEAALTLAVGSWESFVMVGGHPVRRGHRRPA